MMKELSVIVPEVLPKHHLDALKKHVMVNSFQPIDIGGTEMYAMDVPVEIKQWIIGFTEELLDKKLEEVAIYCRYNSSALDTTFRVHSDGLIQGQQPTIASVLYLTTGNTGTALYTHPEHGSEGLGKIFQEDDGKWELIDFCEEVENTMFVYNANSFHSRFPHKARGERVVVVSFLKEK